jgi:hypothetical protein
LRRGASPFTLLPDMNTSGVSPKADCLPHTIVLHYRHVKTTRPSGYRIGLGYLCTFLEMDKQRILILLMTVITVVVTMLAIRLLVETALGETEGLDTTASKIAVITISSLIILGLLSFFVYLFKKRLR